MGRITNITVDELFDFERKSGVFDIADCNGLKLWSIFRYELKNHETSSFVENVVGANEKNSVLCKILKYIKSGDLFKLIVRKICLFSELIRFSMPKRYDYLFYMNGRNVENGKRFDRNLYEVLQIAGEKQSLIFETSSLMTDRKHIRINWLYKTKPYGYHIYLRYLSRNVGLIPVDNDYIDRIYSAVKKYFGNELISRDVLSCVYQKFYCDINFWTCVFKKHQIKKVFFVSNGILKGLIYAAKKMNIPIYEAQHGNIVREHLNYSYPCDIAELDKKVIMPDKILGFSKYWFTKVICPSDNVVIGNSYFSEKAVCNEKRDSMLVIISDIFGHELCEQLLDTILTWNGNVIIKLHPGEYGSFDWYKQFFCDCPNVRIVCAESTIAQLLSETKVLITSASTCVWEALNSGIPVIICKLTLWETMQALQGLEGVTFCDKISDIDFQKINYSIKPITFFEPFDVELAREIVKI